MIRLEITEEDIREAKEMSGEMGQLHNSITSGDGNIAGFVGEIAVRNYLGAVQANTYNYDLIAQGRTIDVKTKRTKVTPKGYYDCSVAAFNTKQACDYYAFVRVTNDLKHGWLLGIIPKETYFSEARLLKKGEVDGDNGFVVKADCYNMQISEVGMYSEHGELMND